jgi:hypothetical protein
MDIEMLKTIAQQAQSKMRHVYELYDLGEPPSVTPGIVEAVLEAAEQAEPPAAWDNVPLFPLMHQAPELSKIVTAPSDDVEAAVIARLRELAFVMPDGTRLMPTQAMWDKRRGDLPNAALLYENWGRRHWAEWAELAGLAYAGPRNSGKRKTRKTEADATPEATFRGAQVSDDVARYAVNGAPASD